MMNHVYKERFPKVRIHITLRRAAPVAVRGGEGVLCSEEVTEKRRKAFLLQIAGEEEGSRGL